MPKSTIFWQLENLSSQEILSYINQALKYKKYFTNPDISTDQKNNFADKLKQHCLHAPVGLMFLEPSLRTYNSFVVALQHLGLNYLSVSKQNSMSTKNEDLHDNIFNLYALGVRLFIIRCQDSNYISKIPALNDLCLINAGSGTSQHPTQCLLDLMTIQECLSSLMNLQVLFVGDTKHSRVFHENFMALKKFNATLMISSPAKYLQKQYLPYSVDLESGIKKADVVFLLRNQYERHDQSLGEVDPFLKYMFREKHYQALKPNALVLHPGPVN